MNNLETRLYEGLRQLWQITKGHPAIKLAVIDGSVDITHTCFDGANLQSLKSDYHNNNFTSHGTHVASLLFGQHHSKVLGIAPQVSGLLISLFDTEEEVHTKAVSQLDMARAINTAIDAGAHIISLSAGEWSDSGEPEFLLARALEQCEKQNILVVAAAGNDACKCLHVPAATPTVLSVGAVDAQGVPQAYSNWGNNYMRNGIVTLGADILGAIPKERYSKKSGTSFATPLVAGIAALYLSAQIEHGMQAKPLAVRDLLLSSAIPCPDTTALSCNRYLRGILNIEAVLEQLRQQRAPNSSTQNNFSVTPSASNTIIHQPIKLVKMDNTITNVPNVKSAEVTFQASMQSVEQNDGVNLSAKETTLKLDTTTTKVELSDCGCDGKKKKSTFSKPQLVYALGTIGYDFVSESRRDSFQQTINANLADPAVIAEYFQQNLVQSTDIVWTLEQENTPIYAIYPLGAFAMEGYKIILDFLSSQVKEGVEQVSIPGRIGGSYRLMSGQEVPLIIPNLRGMASWSTKALVASLSKKKNATEVLANFLERVYYELRNLGTTSMDRAVNFAATNAFQANSIFQKAIEEDMELSNIEAEKSPIARPGIDAYDVKLTFFNPKHRFEQARKVYRFTVDISDEIPVTIGTVRSWSVY